MKPTEIKNILQQFSIKTPASVNFNADNEFSDEVKQIFEDKCCSLMNAYARDDANAMEILNSVQDLVNYVNEQYPPGSEYRKQLSMILEQTNLLADKISDGDSYVAGDNNLRLGLGAISDPEEEVVGEIALTLSEQLTETYQATYADENANLFAACSMAAVLLIISDAMTTLGLMEANTLSKINDDYVTAKAAFADFQKIVTRLKTFFDTASSNAKTDGDGGDDAISASKSQDWYAWLLNKDPIPWNEIPLPQELIPIDNFPQFKKAVTDIVQRYRLSGDNEDSKQFINYLNKNNKTRDQWFKESIQGMMRGDPVYWGQGLNDSDKPWTTSFSNTEIKFNETNKNTSIKLAFPFDENLISEIFKEKGNSCIPNELYDGKKWLTKDNLLKMEKALANKISSIAPHKMVDDLLGYTDAFNDVSSFNGFNTWLDAPLKQLSAAQDTINQKMTSINDRVRNIGNTIKDNLSKVQVMI